MCGHSLRHELRAAWLVAAAGALILTGSALGQGKGRGGNDGNRGGGGGRAAQAAPRSMPTPSGRAMPQSAPAARQSSPAVSRSAPSMPQASAPRSMPTIRQAPSQRIVQAGVPQSAPPVIRSAPAPQAPAKQAMTRVPTQTDGPKSPPITRMPAGSKSTEVFRAPPGLPEGGGTGITRPGSPNGGRVPANTGGSKPSRNPATPTESWIKPAAPIDSGHTKQVPAIGSQANAHQNPPVLTNNAWTKSAASGSGASARPMSPGGPRRTPVYSAAAPTPQNWGSHRGVPPPSVSRSDNLRLSLNVGVGFDAAYGFNHGSVNFSFGNSFGYEPYAYPGYGWRRHRYFDACGFDPYARCNPWGGFYYVRSWPCYPFTYWYPGYSVTVHPCGPWYRVAYHRPACGWLLDFSYCNTPCETFSECALVAPAVVVAPPPVYCWSPENTYRYTSVATVCAEVPSSPATYVEESIPAPASAAELAHSTGRELGDTYMKLGDVGSAVRTYDSQLTRHPGDVFSMRSLGIALIERGEVERGAATVERAYRIDPSLAQSAFDRELLRDPTTLGDVLDKAAGLAGQLDGKPEAAAAYLAVAVLMQADGRIGPARTALDKAKDAGLAPRVVEFMQPTLPLQNKP